MSSSSPVILGWSRSAVAAHGGAFKMCSAHDIAAPVVRALLLRAGVEEIDVDAVVAGNALGAGGNPARMLALAAGLPDRCAAYSVDTQCCAGIDAMTLAAGLLASGSAQVVVAGGVEAWSRAPIRQHRPLRAGESAVPYDRPAFAPDPRRDPDMLMAAADYAAQLGYRRADQDRYAMLSHARAMANADVLRAEIVPVVGVSADTCPRLLLPERVARMPATVTSAHDDSKQCALSPLAISPKADGAAFIVMATLAACERMGLRPRMAWLGSASTGGAPEVPMLTAIDASRAVLDRCDSAMTDMAAIELHDAFAVQALSFCDAFGLSWAQINRRGGGLARGHPIGASAAIALVRLLEDLAHDEVAGAMGLSAVAGAGGIGAAAVIKRLA